MQQVIRDVRNAAQEALDRKDAAALSRETEAWKRSAVQYIRNRSDKAASTSTDKAPHRYRGKAYEWLIVMNQQLQTAADVTLEHFRVAEQPSDRLPLTDWPTITLQCDQAADGWGAGWFLKSQRVCLLHLSDLSHRKWNFCQLALKDSNLYSFVCVTTCVVNADHAPWDDARWFQSARESVETWLSTSTGQQDCHM